MDIEDNNDRKGDSIWGRMGFIEWLSLVLPVLFLILGVGLLAGVFFTAPNAHITDSIRWPAGIALCAWGLFRIAMIFRKVNKAK